MICQRGTCTSPLREDLDFARDAVAYNLPTRRFVCYLGHSTHVNTVPLEVAEKTERTTKGLLKKHQKTCGWCGERFMGLAMQRFCDNACQDRSYAARTQSRRSSRRPTSRTQPPVPMAKRRELYPYATRPRDLSMAWV